MIYFYLSIARLDGNQQVVRFFHDLSDTIRFRLNLPPHEPVGFFDSALTQQPVEWSPETSKALKSSPVLVALLSPAYLRDERAGKEWQIFLDRIRLHQQQQSFDPAIDSKRAIIPITWLSLRGPTSHVVSETAVFCGAANGVNQQRPVLEMLRSLRDYGRNYSQFIHDLADHITHFSETVLLTQLETIGPFRDCHNCFALPNEPIGSPIVEVASDESRSFAVETVSGTLAIRVDGVYQRPIAYPKLHTLDLHLDSEGNDYEETVQQRNADMKKLDVWVIDDDVQMLGAIEETCNLSGLFDVQVYDDASLALRDLELRSFQQQDEPDLFVVDLELKPGEMQGLQFIEELSQKKIRSAIMAVSGRLAEKLPRALAIGAIAAVPKPFSLDHLLEQMEHWATVGRKNRQFGSNVQVIDNSRKVRPVFLSYCGHDLQAADYLRRNLEFRNIGVWYAADTLEPGVEWREEIRRGLTRAQVFVPLITEAFLDSPYCKAELANMLRLLKTESAHSRWLMPVLYNYSAKDATDELLKRCFKYQCVNMNEQKLIDGFNTLLVRIQQVLRTVNGGRTKAAGK